LGLRRYHPIFFCYLPAATVIPLSIIFIKDLNLDGVYLFYQFISSAIKPSLDLSLISNAFNSIQITIFFAIFSWIISIVVGVFLGIISSDIFFYVLNIPTYFKYILKFILSPIRSIHEVIWGLFLIQLFGLNPLISIIAIAVPYSAIIARITSDQINNIEKNTIIALSNMSKNSFAALITIIFPEIKKVISTYGRYRFECSIRSATTLGIFGLGGIGNEIFLSLQALKFNNLWTYLWLMLLIILLQRRIIDFILINKRLISKKILLYLFIPSLYLWINSLNIDFKLNISLDSYLFNNLNLNNINFESSNILRSIKETILLALLAGGFAISMPPLILLIFQNKLSRNLIYFIWEILRLLPTPLTTLILVICNQPTIALAAISLGLNNIGILGQLLKSNLDQRNNNNFYAIYNLSKSKRISWLYSKMLPEATRYLAYSAYRTDVIIRETIVVGLIGSVGIGWQLQESLTSFAWNEVFILIIIYSSITLTGELINEKIQSHWISYTDK
tara:strand:+ start:1053 stop:2567 length:1515 start_codon:yes stop_codon:yes gene_type:complete